MNRRDIIKVLGGAAAWPVAARAQLFDRARGVAMLVGSSVDDPVWQRYNVAFREALANEG